MQKKVTLLLETKDVKFMAKPCLCLMNRLSIGVEQANLQECGELGASCCWCSEEQGLREDGACRGPQQGEAWFSSSFRDSQWQGVPTAAFDLWPSHHPCAEGVILALSVPEITPSLQLGWSIGYFGLEKFTIVQPSGFYSKDLPMQGLCWMSETMLLICWFCEVVCQAPAGLISIHLC